MLAEVQSVALFISVYFASMSGTWTNCAVRCTQSESYVGSAHDLTADHSSEGCSRCSTTPLAGGVGQGVYPARIRRDCHAITK